MAEVGKIGRPNLTKAQRFEKTRKRWEEAERGTDGLRTVRWIDFYDIPAGRHHEVLTEPTILTVEGVETCVVMTIEQLLAMKAVNPNPSRQPRMVRVEGILYREVL